MKNLTEKERFIANNKIERLIANALDLNPKSEIERINEITVKINGFVIVCKNFNEN